ncbi:MAG TPA: YtfJ family protein [Polyangia bacterium]
MMPYRALTGIAIVAAATAAWALPPIGAVPPRVAVENVAARALRPLPDARPVLVMYEDKEAQTQNEHARKVLGRITDRAENRARFEFAAVADVAKWNWWPAKKYVLEDLQKIAARENTVLFADWTGALRKAWGLTAHKSALVLTGADGRVLFAGEGTLSDAQLGALVAELEKLGCRTRE